MVDLKILVVEDEAPVRELLASTLMVEGFAVDEAADAETAERLLDSRLPSLILLDWMLPGMNGLEFTRWMKRDETLKQIPIIMLTARGDVVDRVSGLEIGADNYIGKPFEPRELVARIQSILRRVTAAESASPVLRFDGIEIDSSTNEARVDGQRVELTSMEFRLLEILAKRAGRKVSRDDVLNELRGIDAAIMTRSVDIMISRLRQKLGDSVKPPRFIQTIWGRGYSVIGIPVTDD